MGLAGTDNTFVRELAVLHLLAQPVEHAIRSLHADVGGDEHFLDFLEQRGIDVGTTAEQLGQASDEAAPRVGQALLERSDVALVFRRLDRDFGRCS
jgi:hypothetical protein